MTDFHAVARDAVFRWRAHRPVADMRTYYGATLDVGPYACRIVPEPLSDDAPLSVQVAIHAGGMLLATERVTLVDA